MPNYLEPPITVPQYRGTKGECFMCADKPYYLLEARHGYHLYSCQAHFAQAAHYVHRVEWKGEEMYVTCVADDVDWERP
jgi:hypothetical protein